MPVQINEMIIRANIMEPHEEQPDAQKKPAEGNVNKDEIIRECTEIILEILQHKNER